MYELWKVGMLNRARQFQLKLGYFKSLYPDDEIKALEEKYNYGLELDKDGSRDYEKFNELAKEKLDTEKL